MGVLIALCIIAIYVFVFAAIWRVLSKAGYPGWAAVIPIYNIIILLKVARLSPWWVLFCLVPFGGIIVNFMCSIGIAQGFGKDIGFGIGLALLPFIFFPILAFGNSEYSPE